ncbi:hypothetical protein MB46_11380 [Arthrobacter alpinus]|nr:hypothetical protein MB46_11380 [Arthrobacter alpinus]
MASSLRVIPRTLKNSSSAQLGWLETFKVAPDAGIGSVQNRQLRVDNVLSTVFAVGRSSVRSASMTVQKKQQIEVLKAHG